MLLNVREPIKDGEVAVSLSQQIARSASKPDGTTEIPENEIEQLRKSGLLSLLIPENYGGVGATWEEALAIVSDLSKADASIGQLYGNHLILTALGQIFGTPEYKERYYRQTAQNQCLWGNAIDLWDTKLTITPEGDRFRLNGVRSVDSGVAAADVRIFSALQEGVTEPVFLIVPKDRLGVISYRDGKSFGQGHIDRITFKFQNVLVEKDEILGSSSNLPNRAFGSFLGTLAQLTKIYICLGIGQSALEAIRTHGKTINTPRLALAADSDTSHSCTLDPYSNLWIELKTANRLARQAAQLMQASWEEEFSLTSIPMGEVLSAVFSAEAFATRVGLEITNLVFERIGNHATAPQHSFLRYLSDLRAFGGVSMPWQGVSQPWMLSHVPHQHAPC